MQSFKQILVPTDLSDSADGALHVAAHWARQHDARLHLLYVLTRFEGEHLPGVPDLQPTYRRLEAVVSARLSSLCAAPLLRGLTVIDTVQQASAVTPAILGYAEKHGVDLIAMGTHGRQGADCFLIGSTAERVVRHARATVLTVGPSSRPSAPHPIRHLLVPVDLSVHAREVIGRARDLAAYYQARLSLLHVVEPVVWPVFYSDHPVALELDVQRDAAHVQNQMEQLFEHVKGPDVPVTFSVAHGRPAREIMAFARREAVHLIVQGARGLTNDPLPVGSVAEAVVRTAPCPVLTVRPQKIERVRKPSQWLAAARPLQTSA